MENMWRVVRFFLVCKKKIIIDGSLYRGFKFFKVLIKCIFVEYLFMYIIVKLIVKLCMLFKNL